MISRDVIVDALRAYAISQKREIAANIFGKLKTIFQMIAIFVIFFLFNSDQVNQRLNYYLFQNLGMYLALIFSILSGVIYFVKYTKKVQTPK
jgi:CDP-diacylglycerol--glycerol-3-phosphate 3-phosphatidyltransferase